MSYQLGQVIWIENDTNEHPYSTPIPHVVLLQALSSALLEHLPDFDQSMTSLPMTQTMLSAFTDTVFQFCFINHTSEPQEKAPRLEGTSWMSQPCSPTLPTTARTRWWLIHHLPPASEVPKPFQLFLGILQSSTELCVLWTGCWRTISSNVTWKMSWKHRMFVSNIPLWSTWVSLNFPLFFNTRIQSSLPNRTHPRTMGFLHSYV